jgi:ATP-binding cassette, subfamily B, multidrug efflux pump
MRSSRSALDKGSFDLSLIRRFLPFLRPHWGLAATSLGLVPLLSLAHIARPYLTKLVIDEGISAENPQKLGLYCLILLATSIAAIVLGYLHSFVTNLTGQKVVRDIRSKVFDFLQTRSVRFYEANPTGVLVTRGTNDLELVGDMFSSGVIMTVSDVLRLLGIVAIMLHMNLKLTLVLLAAVPLILFIGYFLGGKARLAFRRQRNAVAEYSAAISETVAGRKLIQIFRAGAANERRFDEINEELRDAGVNGVIYESFLFATMELLAWLAAAGLIWFGGGQIVRQALTFGELVAFLEYISMFFDPLRDLSAKYSILQSGLAALEKTDALLHDENQLAEPSDPVAPQTPPQELSLSGVNFSYTAQEPVLQEINLEIKAGEKVALIGATGAGKSTLLKLLVRFHDPVDGTIRAGGKKLTDFSLQYLRRNIGLVVQEVHLFEGSILDNITLWRNDISREQALAAAAKIGLDEMVSRLPLGYDTPLEERGSNLSFGERQLISLARALAYDPQILLLDEATANIDTPTERKIIRALAETMQGRTSIVVAHGKIVEQGTAKQLIRHKGVYYRLAKLIDNQAQ